MNPKDFVDQILEFEAESILMDLAFSPALVGVAFEFDESRKRRSLEFVVSILRDAYDHQHLQIAVSNHGSDLYGYAMLFAYAGQPVRYLHKVYVHEEFRGQGVGTGLLEAVTNGDHTTALTCSVDVEKFYSKKGFEYVRDFEVPDSSDFRLSKHLYSGLVLMTNGSGYQKAPVFMLNDDDIRKIMGIALGKD